MNSLFSLSFREDKPSTLLFAGSSIIRSFLAVDPNRLLVSIKESTVNESQISSSSENDVVESVLSLLGLSADDFLLNVFDNGSSNGISKSISKIISSFSCVAGMITAGDDFLWIRCGRRLLVNNKESISPPALSHPLSVSSPHLIA